MANNKSGGENGNDREGRTGRLTVMSERRVVVRNEWNVGMVSEDENRVGMDLEKMVHDTPGMFFFYYYLTFY